MTDLPLTADERARLESLADALIPMAPGHLSASEAGVGGALLDQALIWVPDLQAGLRAALAAAGAGPAQDALAAFRARDAAAYDAFCETIAAIYFLSPRVRTAVGFPGREPKPARVDTGDLEDLLMPVLDAGFSPRSF